MARIDRDRLRALDGWLDRALELTADERERWLGELRRDSPALADDLAAVLAGEASADRRGFLAEPLVWPYTPAASAGGMTGLRLGSYVVERPLGEGGMGSVWLARRVDGRYEGEVAVKFLKLALAGPVGQARFRREGSVLARLAHPGIARLLDAGVAAGGQPYLVLEYVDGERIDAWADARRLALAERVRLVLQVLAAVGHAHARLIVHRDLKPSNILVAADGAAKLLDFGIAKLLADEGEGGALTTDGGRVLTPEFASPEQFQGDAVGTATDVYAVGALLYRLLTGCPPFDVAGRSVLEIARLVGAADPPRPSARFLGGAAARADLEARARARGGTPERLHRQLRGDLDAIVLKALAREPERRYPSAAALAEDLERFLAAQPVRARPVSPAYRARKFVRRHRAAVGAAALAASALVGATAFSLAQMGEARRQRDAAVFEKKRGDAQREFEYLLMSRLGDRPLTMRELLDQGRALLERDYVGDPRFLGTVYLELASHYGDLGDRAVQMQLLARAESLAVAVPGRRDLAEIRCQMAENLRTGGRLAESRRALDGAAALLRGRPDPRAEAFCLQRRADLEVDARRPDESIRAARRALAVYDSLGETRGTAYLSALNALAGALESAGRVREAVAVYGRTAALMDSIGRGDAFMSVILRHNTAAALLMLGETAAAERLERDVVSRSARADPAGRVHPIPLSYYALALAANARPDSSLKYYRAMAARSVEDADTAGHADALFGEGRALAQLGDVAGARRTQARLREVGARLPGRARADEAMLAGWIAAAAGDPPAAAHAHFVEALRHAGYVDGAHVTRLRAKFFLVHPALVRAAETALAAGRPDRALALARDAAALAAFDARAEGGSAYVGEARLVEARALLARGDSAGARAASARAAAALRAGAGAGHPLARAAAAVLDSAGG